jgi:hypothetical protein
MFDVFWKSGDPSRAIFQSKYIQLTLAVSISLGVYS